jgi:transposase
MRAYSLDLRVRVFADYDAGQTFAQLARKYSVSAEWVRQIVRRRERTGELAARRPIPRRVPFRASHEAEIRRAVAEAPDLTLAALRERLHVDVSLATLHNALVALKLTLKKSRSGRPSRSSGRRSRGPGPSSASSKGPWPTPTGSSSSTRRG